MKKLLCLFIAFIASLLVITAQTQGSTMYVTVKKVAVKSSTGFFASTRGTLEVGSTVTVLRAGDKWTEIRSASPALTGWIASAALTAKRISSSGQTLSTEEIAMAGKGFSGEIEQIYRQGEKSDYASVDAMESLVIPDGELYEFLTQGRLAAGD
jgi:hypothetical protein